MSLPLAILWAMYIHYRIFFSSINSKIKILKILKNFLIPARVNILSYIGSGKHDDYLGFIY